MDRVIPFFLSGFCDSRSRVKTAIILVTILLVATIGKTHAQHSSSADDLDVDNCDVCQFRSPSSAYFDLSALCGGHSAVLETPLGARLDFGVCNTVPCTGNSKSSACIRVPGEQPTSAGEDWKFSLIEKNVPGEGVRLTISNGEVCKVNKRQRKTIVDFKCSPNHSTKGDILFSKASEGSGSDLCTYHLVALTPHACPAKRFKYSKLSPVITAVTGCIDSDPSLFTSECPTKGGIPITVHGHSFSAPGQTPDDVEITIGENRCTDVHIVNGWTLTCSLPQGNGENNKIAGKFTMSTTKSETGGTPIKKVEQTLASSSEATVSYRPLADYHQHFQSMVDLGVGGLGPQIRELYQRAFASRSIPSATLDQMGIDHAKGILLHGPPGSGKTLLAKTIARILNTEQVRLVNAPEVMSKYLGESEKNLRSHFMDAEKAWAELGDASDLFIIIIDEIDAICKQRGKSDTSAAAAAYDSVVNQLLTNMDGLRSLHNVLVIGMTNRPELIDPALLRPGRFEIQIEIGLPDETGRWEIFFIHTKSMRDNGLLSADVDLRILSQMTSQFSGAEIAGVIRMAASFALDRKYSSAFPDQTVLLVTMEDFKQALKQFKPAYTQKGVTILDQFIPNGYTSAGTPFTNIIEDIANSVSLLHKSKLSQLESVLLFGRSGTGKSALAAHITSLVDFNFVKAITPNDLLRLNSAAREDVVLNAFQDAYKAEFGVLILDDLDLLVEGQDVNGEVIVSSSMLHNIRTLLTTQPPPGCKLLVLATVRVDQENINESLIQRTGLVQEFNKKYEIPPLKTANILSVLKKMGFSIGHNGLIDKLSNKELPFVQLIKLVDCVDNSLQVNNRTRSDDSQALFNECLLLYRLL